MPHYMSFHYATIFWFISFVVTYWPRWLQDRGFDSEEIGLILASAVWMKVPLNLILGSLSQRSGHRRKYIRMLSSIVFLAMPLFYLSQSFSLYIVLWAIVGASITALIPMTDSISVVMQNKSQLNYGRVRLWGSLSFIVAAIFGGWILDSVGIGHTLTLMIMGAIALLFSSSLLPDLRSHPNLSSTDAFKTLLNNSEFLLFLLVVALIQSSHTVLYGFASIHWRSLGISETVIGWLWAEGVVAEILIFYFSARFIAWFGPWRLLMLGSAMATMRWVGLANTSSIIGLALLQWMHAFSFALTHLGMMEFLRQKVSTEDATSAQTLVDAVALGLAFGGTMLLAGIAYGYMAGSSWYIMGAMTAVAFLMAGSGRLKFQQAKKSF